LEECRPCPVFVGFTLVFALQLREKHGKTSVRVPKSASWHDKIIHKCTITTNYSGVYDYEYNKNT